MVERAGLHRRRSLRLQGYDYAQDGAYFVTLCTHDRECLFGEIVDGVMRLSDAGVVVSDECFKTAQIRKTVRLNVDEFVVMSNRVHGILWIMDVGVIRRVAPTGAGRRPTDPAPGSVGAILAQFKSAVSKSINALHGTRGIQIWQRNYHEHIIRDDNSLNRIREYIGNNPRPWVLDRENPANGGAASRDVGATRRVAPTQWKDD